MISTIQDAKTQERFKQKIISQCSELVAMQHLSHLFPFFPHPNPCITQSCHILTCSTCALRQPGSHSVSRLLSPGLLLSFGAMREQSSLPDGMAAVCKYQAALLPPCFSKDYEHCINTEVLSMEYTQTTHQHKTHTHTHTHTHISASAVTAFLQIAAVLFQSLFSYIVMYSALIQGKVCPPYALGDCINSNRQQHELKSKKQ